METRHLELLRELAVRGTLAAVAEATHRTPSALSQQLRTAERDFGVALVEPVGRGLRLTTEGELLADAADEVCRVQAQVQARLDAARGEPSGRVSIGTLPSAGEALLPGLVKALRGSAIELTLDDFDLAEADYATRTLDVDVVIAHSLSGDVPAGAQRLTSHVLVREPIDVALPTDHPLASRERLHPRDLVGTTWIGVPEGYPFDTILLAVEALTGQTLERRQRLRDNQLIRALVGRGEGLALLPRFTTPADGRVVLRPLAGVPAQRAIVALCRPDRHARLAVRTVVDELERVGAGLTAIG
ncbi:LysR family transcriptional regulator [Serinicoccus profundi]|uniref:LysR family transcriptional regulator n=1 Tax=Serinicoccus profundi TaxID=1078471 RepID=UPI000255E377|nr:LysR family transcriptional regulator [Serinicoccus profundi]